MLEFELTPKHAGLRLWGDYFALKRLYDFVHHVVEESSAIEDKEGFVLGLAYDIRKAFQGQRSRSFRADPNDDGCHVYGVEILWPVLLVQVALLRQALAFIPTNRLDQAIMFELEHVVEAAVRKAMPITADEVIHRMQRIGTAPYTHLDSVLGSRCRYFIERPAKERLKVLPRLMETLDPMYPFLVADGTAIRPGVIPPDAFVEGNRGWPDFEW